MGYRPQCKNPCPSTQRRSGLHADQSLECVCSPIYLHHRCRPRHGSDYRRYVRLASGLALDVGIYSDHIDFIRPDFPYTGISQIFRETAPFFGLIERYGAAKESITGISHEPWHFRYVGYPHAVFMNEKQLCLEEYTDLLHTFTIDHPLYVENHTIFFHPYDQQLNLPERIGYEVSGNNVDGLIITVSDRI